MINDLNASQKDKENHILAIKSGEQTIQAMSRENNMLTKKNESLTTEVQYFVVYHMCQLSKFTIFQHSSPKCEK